MRFTEPSPDKGPIFNDDEEEDNEVRLAGDRFAVSVAFSPPHLPNVDDGKLNHQEIDSNKIDDAEKGSIEVNTEKEALDNKEKEAAEAQLSNQSTPNKYNYSQQSKSNNGGAQAKYMDEKAKLSIKP